MLQVMTGVGPDKIAACVTDNAANMASARSQAAKDPTFSHIIFIPCFMQGFSLLIGSLLAHEYARSIISNASKIVTFFRASHCPLEALNSAAKALGINGSLQKPNATRFTSIFSLLNSVKQHEQPLKSLVDNDALESLTKTSFCPTLPVVR